jgi:iron complex transport system substrate-binding protein
MKRSSYRVLTVLGALLLGSGYFGLRAAPSDPESAGRIVSLAPNLTELLFELGVGSQVVGVTTYCVYPPETQKIEKIGGFINPSLEKILSLEPQLVFSERWTSSKTVPTLRRLGLHVVEVPSPFSLAEIYQLMRIIGEALGRTARAEQLVEAMMNQVRQIREKAKSFPRRPTLYVEIDPPSWTVGSRSFVNEAISLCGAQNIFGDVNRPALQASKEVIVSKDPEIILSFDASAAEIGRRPGWHRIRAVRNGAVIDDLDRDLLTHGNHRLVEGMRQLQQRVTQSIESLP